MAYAHIILCTYNPDPEFFRAQIDSICRQTFTSWTCAVLDDASDAASLSFVAEVLSSDQRFTLDARVERAGVFHNFERGVAATPSDAEIIFYCDQDDIWHSDKIESIIECFKVDPMATLVHSDLDLIDAAGNCIGASCFAAEQRNIDNMDCGHLLIRNAVTGCAAAFRSTIIPRLLPFPRQDGEVRFHHDQWTAIVASIMGQVVTLHRPLVSYRQHGHNIVGANMTYGTGRERASSWLLRVIRRRSIFGPLKHAWAPRRRLVAEITAAISSKRLPATTDALKMVGWTARALGPIRLFFVGMDQRRRGDPVAIYTLKFALAEMLTQLGIG